METEKKYPVYQSHVWELLAVINCLAPYAQRRQDNGRQSNLDMWLAGFIEMLELLACKMTTKGKDGIVYLNKDEFELVKKLSNFIRVNGVLRNGEVVKNV